MSVSVFSYVGLRIWKTAKTNFTKCSTHVADGRVTVLPSMQTDTLPFCGRRRVLTFKKFSLQKFVHPRFSWCRIVHGSILCDPIQPNPLADWPNPTHYKWKNMDPTRPNPIQLTMIAFRQLSRSAVNSNLTAWCNQILSNRALSESTQSFQIFYYFCYSGPNPTQSNPRKTEKSRPNPT